MTVTANYEAVANESEFLNAQWRMLTTNPDSNGVYVSPLDNWPKHFFPTLLENEYNCDNQETCREALIIWLQERVSHAFNTFINLTDNELTDFPKLIGISNLDKVMVHLINAHGCNKLHPCKWDVTCSPNEESISNYIYKLFDWFTKEESKLDVLDSETIPHPKVPEFEDQLAQLVLDKTQLIQPYIHFMVMVGSYGNNDAIPGISDLDILVCLKKETTLNSSMIKHFRSALMENSFDFTEIDELQHHNFLFIFEPFLKRWPMGIFPLNTLDRGKILFGFEGDIDYRRTRQNYISFYQCLSVLQLLRHAFNNAFEVPDRYSIKYVLSNFLLFPSFILQSQNRFVFKKFSFADYKTFLEGASKIDKVEQLRLENYFKSGMPTIQDWRNLLYEIVVEIEVAIDKALHVVNLPPPSPQIKVAMNEVKLQNKSQFVSEQFEIANVLSNRLPNHRFASYGRINDSHSDVDLAIICLENNRASSATTMDESAKEFLEGLEVSGRDISFGFIFTENSLTIRQRIFPFQQFDSLDGQGFAQSEPAQFEDIISQTILILLDSGFRVLEDYLNTPSISNLYNLEKNIIYFNALLERAASPFDGMDVSNLNSKFVHTGRESIVSTPRNILWCLNSFLGVLDELNDISRDTSDTLHAIFANKFYIQGDWSRAKFLRLAIYSKVFSGSNHWLLPPLFCNHLHQLQYSGLLEHLYRVFLNFHERIEADHEIYTLRFEPSFEALAFYFQEIEDKCSLEIRRCSYLSLNHFSEWKEDWKVVLSRTFSRTSQFDSILERISMFNLELLKESFYTAIERVDIPLLKDLVSSVGTNNLSVEVDYLKGVAMFLISPDEHRIEITHLLKQVVGHSWLEPWSQYYLGELAISVGELDTAKSNFAKAKDSDILPSEILQRIRLFLSS
jgi:hypothetical protein